MRHFPFLCASLALILAAAPAWSQEEVTPPEDQDTIEAAGEEKLPVEKEEGKEPTTATGRTEVQEDHTVIPGDTLWDLCSKYLNNPWYWPRVWSYNPEINNPHWIYPGQRVRFYPGAGELPSEIDAGREFEVPEPVSEGDEMEEVPENLVQMTGKIVQARRATSVIVKKVAFVTEAEMEDSGVIEASPEEKVHLAENDMLYVRFNDPGAPKVGQNYILFRTEKEIYHPITGDFIGFYTAVKGVGQVVRLDEKMATLVVTTSLDYIQRGDKVAPYTGDLSAAVVPKANAVEARGYVVGSQIELANIGEVHLVFLDQGKQQGIEEGNVFDVVRREDGLREVGAGQKEGVWNKDMPMEIIGRVMVVDSRPTASTGLVMASLKEIRVGDRVLMSIR